MLVNTIAPRCLGHGGDEPAEGEEGDHEHPSPEAEEAGEETDSDRGKK